MKKPTSVALALGLVALSLTPSSAATHLEVPSWGLDRIDNFQSTLTLDRSFTFPDHGGAGVLVYVMDTGVQANLPGFEGRVAIGFDAVAGFRVPHSANRDCNGHGTAVAGIIASASYGVARKATIVPVRVTDCRGGVGPAAIIKGIDWIRKNHPRNTPGVVNMSIAVGKNKSVDDAIDRLYEIGLVTVAAAGNQNMDACRLSPAGSPRALTVASINMNDQRTNTSNFGECVSIYAPGGLILTEGHLGNPSTRSGTSMAAPHVAGVIALYLSNNRSAKGAETIWTIIRNGQPGVVLDAKSTKGNVLLNMAFLNK
jgi:subtilisin family serine protease